GTCPELPSSVARGVSADGSVVAGSCYQSTALFSPFRWTSAGGLQPLVLPIQWESADAGAISADGSAITGYAYLCGGCPIFAFRWTSAQGFEDLGAIAGGTDSLGAAISGDGSVVAGDGTVGGLVHAARWTLATGTQDLGVVGRARAVSRD